jgi:hypothetical protein
MTKSVLTTLSLSFFTVAVSVGSPPSDQNGLLSLASMPIESVRFGRSTQVEIDLGWEQQQRLIDSRLVAKAMEPLSVPGAIISSPFPGFAPFSAEVPSAGAVGSGPRPSNRGSRPRGSATNRS